MKIAIQGHPTRGKEIIQILESLGGINDGLHEGNNPDCYYELHSNIIWCVSTKGINFKYYTLEEFEKAFPFKIGDKVIYDYTPNFVGTVVNIKFDDNIPYRVNINGIICTCGTNMLKLCKEMKEGRNITLTLDKAKEWYNKGGELKEIALQAFTEQELNPLPRSWEEYCEKYPVKKGECVIESEDRISATPWGISIRRLKTWIPSKKSAEAHLAMIQLEQLRDCWRQGWVQTPTDTGYRINKTLTGDYVVMSVGSCKYFLSFPTRKMAEEFLECFRDLIEKAGDLI